MVILPNYLAKCWYGYYTLYFMVNLLGKMGKKMLKPGNIFNLTLLVLIMLVFLTACYFTQTKSINKNIGVKLMKLESTAFTANDLIPSKYTCDKQDISPPLIWDEVPENTQSFALICDDPDAPMGTFVHWVLYNIPPESRQLIEAIPKQQELSIGGIQGKNDFGKIGYGGPCPPRGTHRYFFKLYAIDRKLQLKPGATKDELLKAMAGHQLATAEIIGQYQRQR